MGVFDGHGTNQFKKGLNGHFISNCVKQFFIKRFFNPKTYGSTANDLNSLKEVEIYTKLTENNYKIIISSFRESEQELINNAKYDVNFSGTTAIILMIINDKVICANCGDSRAFLTGDKRNNPCVRII